MNYLHKILISAVIAKFWLVFVVILTFVSTTVSGNSVKRYGANNQIKPEQLQQKISQCISKQSSALAQDFTVKLQKQLKLAKSGGLVRVPGGSYMITGTVNVPAGVKLIGAGMGKTIFYRNPTKHKNSKLPLLRVHGNNSKQITRISGIGFVGNCHNDDAGWDKAIELRGVTNFRIDHCFFRRFGFAAIAVRQDSSGVIDHSIFYSIYKPAIKNVGYGVVVFRGNIWEENKQLGTKQAVFVEDCIFMGCRHAIAANGGAHYVFRYNIVRKNVVASSIDAHGRGFGSKSGTRCVEIYNNLLELPISPAKTGIRLRGGKGVVFDNKIKGYAIPIQLVIERGTPKELKATYPATNQIRDLWLWNNRAIGGGSIKPSLPSSNRGFIKENRDFFRRVKPGYKPYPYPHPLTVDKNLNEE